MGFTGPFKSFCRTRQLPFADREDTTGLPLEGGGREPEVLQPGVFPAFGTPQSTGQSPFWWEHLWTSHLELGRCPAVILCQSSNWSLSGPVIMKWRSLELSKVLKEVPPADWEVEATVEMVGHAANLCNSDDLMCHFLGVSEPFVFFHGISEIWT